MPILITGPAGTGKSAYARIMQLNCVHMDNYMYSKVRTVEHMPLDAPAYEGSLWPGKQHHVRIVKMLPRPLKIILLFPPVESVRAANRLKADKKTRSQAFFLQMSTISDAEYRNIIQDFYDGYRLLGYTDIDIVRTSAFTPTTGWDDQRLGRE